MRALAIALLVAVSSTARADPPAVDAELRRLADRAATWASPAGLAPLVEERVAAGDLEGLGDVIASLRRQANSGVDEGWLAAAYGAAGNRAEVERLAASVEKAIQAVPDEPMNDSARCGIAVGFEYLGDEAESDRWRKAATGVYAWCDERLPVIAARAGRHERAAALLAEETFEVTRVALLQALAGAYVEIDKTRAAPLLEEAERLVDEGSPGLMLPSSQWPDLAVLWARAGKKKQARAMAKRALAALDDEAESEPAMLLLLGDDVAEALAAAGDKKALGTLLARLEKARAKDDRFVARLQNARLVATFGAKKRGKALVAAVARDLDDGKDDGAGFAARFALIDAYLALGDLPAAIEQASLTSVTQPIEIEALVKIARHCRLHRCKRSKAVTAALAAVAARLDKIDALRP
jgi:hypothetical protein